MTRTTKNRTVAALVAGLASVTFMVTPTIAHADEIKPYLGWDEPAKPGDCPMVFTKGRELRPGETIPINPEDHNSGWTVDSEVQNAKEIGDNNTRWVQNGVAEVRVTIECDHGRQTYIRHYGPTKYKYRYKWTGTACLPHIRTTNAGCMPYAVPPTKWRDGSPLPGSGSPRP